MKISVLLRVVKNKAGELDVSLVPGLPSDIKKCLKLTKNVLHTVELRGERDPDKNGKIHALCSYVVANLPERYYQVDPLSGDKYPTITSKEMMYRYVEVMVGFCDPIPHPDNPNQIYYVPKETKFEKLNDEIEYREKFHDKAIKFMAHMMDTTPSGLVKDSIEWRKEMQERKPWQ